MDRLVERSMQVAGHRTRVLELDGTGPGIVLLHGWGASADAWRPLLGALALCGRRAIAVDLPLRLAPGAILEQLDDFAAALVHEWGRGEPVVVAGDSLGGCLALRLAEQAGQLPVAGVVPVAPAGMEEPAWFDAVERDPIIRRLLDIPIPVPRALVRAASLGRPPFDLDAAACPVLLVRDAQPRPEDLLELLLTF
jgi:pimeloyl-ACP methyl ester carboxylesterase